MKTTIDTKVSELRAGDFPPRKTPPEEKVLTPAEKEQLAIDIIVLIRQKCTDTQISQKLNVDDKSLIQYTREAMQAREQELFPSEPEEPKGK